MADTAAVFRPMRTTSRFRVRGIDERHGTSPELGPRTSCARRADAGFAASCCGAARRSFAANPMRRLGDVHDVAEACVSLSAPSGRFITQGHPRVNLVTDILPAMALVRDPAEPGVMRRPPGDPREPLVTWARAVRLLGEAACLAAGVASAYLWVVLQEGAGPRAHTLAFVVLVLIHPLQAEPCRSESELWWRLPPNRLVWAALATLVVVQWCAVSWPPLAGLLGSA